MISRYPLCVPLCLCNSLGKISSSRGSSWPRNQTCVTRIAGILYHLSHQPNPLDDHALILRIYEHASLDGQRDFEDVIITVMELHYHGGSNLIMLPLNIERALAGVRDAAGEEASL